MLNKEPKLRTVKKELKEKLHNKSEKEFLKDLSEDIYFYEYMLYLQEKHLIESKFYNDFIKVNPNTHPGYCTIYSTYEDLTNIIAEFEKWIKEQQKEILHIGNTKAIIDSVSIDLLIKKLDELKEKYNGNIYGPPKIK